MTCRDCSPHSTLLFTAEPTPCRAKAAAVLAMSAPVSIESRAEFSGLALTTIKGYLSTARDYLRFASAWRYAARDQPWNAPDALVEYAFHRLSHSNTAWPSYKYPFKASTAKDALTKIPSTFRSLGIEFRGTRKPNIIGNALAFRQPNGGQQHRPAITYTQFLRTLQTSRGAQKASTSSLICALMYFGMLRSNEPLVLTVNHHDLIHNAQGSVTGIALRFFDKTHKQSRREILFTSREIWKAEFELLDSLLHRAGIARESAIRARLISPNAEVNLFSQTELGVFKTILKEAAGHTGSCMRPGGLMFHVACNHSKWLTIKQGGWSPDSKVFIKAYTRLCSPEAVRRFAEGADILQEEERQDEDADAPATPACASIESAPTSRRAHV